MYQLILLLTSNSTVQVLCDWKHFGSVTVFCVVPVNVLPNWAHCATKFRITIT